MMWMVMMRTRVCVWARINYGRSNQVIMQSRQQPSGKKLITAPDRRGAGGVGWWGRRRRLELKIFWNFSASSYTTQNINI